MGTFRQIKFHDSNSGFEQGALLPGWSGPNAEITADDKKFGDFSAKVTAVNQTRVGVISEAINVDETVLHNIDSWAKLTDGDNMVLNPGFEDDFTNWTAGNSIIDNGIFFSGAKSSKLEAVGAPINGAFNDAINVDENANAQINSKQQIFVWTAGFYEMRVRCFDGLDGTGSLLGTLIVFQQNSTTSGWVSANKTIGPPASGMDLIYPVGTLSIQFRQQWPTAGSTGKAYMDDIDFHYLVTGNYELRIRCYDDVDGAAGGGSLLGSLVVFTKTAVSAWEQFEKTLGPGGADLVFFAGTKSIEFWQQFTASNSSGIGFLDQVVLDVDNSLTIAVLESYPSGRGNQKMQSLQTTPGGTDVTYDLGPEFIFLSLIIRLLSDADRILLLSFIRNIANFRQNPFHYIDGQGNLYKFCNFDFNEVEFRQDFKGRFSEVIDIKAREV